METNTAGMANRCNLSDLCLARTMMITLDDTVKYEFMNDSGGALCNWAGRPGLGHRGMRLQDLISP